MNRSKEVETRPDFQLWLISLDDSADDRDVDVLRANVVSGRHHCDVNV